MRVAILAPPIFPISEAQYGGPHAFIVDMAKELAQHGNEVGIFCAAGSKYRGLNLIPIIAPEELISRITLNIYNPKSKTDLDPDAFKLFESIYEQIHSWQPDIIWANSFDAESIVAGAKYKVVHTLHLGPIESLVVKAAIEIKAVYVTVSQAMQTQWYKAGLTHVLCILNGVPVFRIRVNENPLPCAVIAGRVSPEKGTKIAIDLSRRAGFKPLVIGPVYDSSYYSTLGYPAEHLNRKKLWDVMANSAVTLMPVQFDEPFGLVAAEAQMAGCPVVAYNRGGLAEVIEHGISGFLVEPDNEDSFVEHIKKAVYLSRKNIRRSAIRRLSIKRAVSEYEKLFANVQTGMI